MEVKELVKALRCSATPGGAESCAGCSYRVVDRVSDEDAAKYGFVPGAEFESCDTDRMALDAADLLEKLNAERDAAVKDISEIIGDIEEIRRGYGVDNADADNAFAYLCGNYCSNNGHRCYEESETYRCKHFKWRGLEGRNA